MATCLQLRSRMNDGKCGMLDKTFLRRLRVMMTYEA